MQIQYANNLIPGRFELGTTLSQPNRSISDLCIVWAEFVLTLPQRVPRVHSSLSKCHRGLSQSGNSCQNAGPLPPFPEEAETFSLHRDQFSRLVVISFLGKLLAIYSLIQNYATLSQKLKARVRNCFFFRCKVVVKQMNPGDVLVLQFSDALQE